MKKSKQLDNILEECLKRTLDKGDTVEECLALFPEHATELRQLLVTALAAKKAAVIKPTPQFRERARNQFYLALSELRPKR
jgi:hypothetical protein